MRKYVGSNDEIESSPTFVLFRVRAKHTLPDLAFDYGALEPVISAEIMQLHHQKHHATYVNNLNVAEEKSAEALAKGSFSCHLRVVVILIIELWNHGTGAQFCFFWNQHHKLVL